MDHVDTGVRRLLNYPRLYDVLQRLAGADRLRKRLVDEYVPVADGDRVLDLGCGTGEMLEYLPQGVDYIGVDMNPQYMESARARYGSRGRFICCRIGHLADAHRDLGKFDIVLARALLHHLADQEAGELLEYSSQNLKTDGYLVTLDPVYLEGQSRLARYVMSKDRGQRIRTQDEYRKLASRYFATVESSVLHNMIRLPYTHLLMRMSDGLPQSSP